MDAQRPICRFHGQSIRALLWIEAVEARVAPNERSSQRRNPRIKPGDQRNRVDWINPHKRMRSLRDRVRGARCIEATVIAPSKGLRPATVASLLTRSPCVDVA